MNRLPFEYKAGRILYTYMKWFIKKNKCLPKMKNKVQKSMGGAEFQSSILLMPCANKKNFSISILLFWNY